MVKKLEINLQLYHNIYLEPALLLAVLGTKSEFVTWFNSIRLSQYAAVYNLGDLIYKDGYLKIYDAATEFTRLNRFLDLQSMDECCKGISMATQYIELLNNRKYIIVDFDEYFLKNTYFYDRCHYYRKFLIYGYDDTRKIFFACSHDRKTNLSIFELSFDLAEQLSLRSEGYYSGINSSRIKCIILNIDKKEEIQVKPFFGTKTLKGYIENKIEEKIEDNGNCIYTQIYGQKIYDLIIYRLELLKENIVKLDYRCMQMLSLNRYLLACKIREEAKLTDNRLDCYSDKFAVIGSQLYRYMLMLLHYYANYRCDYLIINRCITELNELKEKEYEYINQMLWIIEP